MMGLFTLCSLGLLNGFVLLWRVPRCKQAASASLRLFSVIIPARNEEKNLPPLLNSLKDSSIQPHEIIVVDDASSDATAEVASRLGARVIFSRELPRGWTGKTWACAQGAEAATAEWFLFLDADTFFAPGGFALLAGFRAAKLEKTTALSALPFHAVQEPYEQLSLFFNLLMAFGAGGFGLVGEGRLFGQSLAIGRELYEHAGGHSAAKGSILENLTFYSNIKAAGGRCVCLGGAGMLNMRMFPHGFRQLCEGWTKAFADGAAASDRRVLFLAVLWLSQLFATCIVIVFTHGAWRASFVLLYLCFALQLAQLARPIGSYRFLAFLLYPLPLMFFFAIFGQSLFKRTFKRKVAWRGRQI